MKDFYGPWCFELSTLEVHDKDGDLIVDANSGDFLKEKSAELGYLIAAAPELREALQSLIINADPKLFSTVQLAQCKAVVNKALGAE